MKKNLFLLLALLCSVTFFVGCGDDEDESWQQIPKEEIKGENAVLKVNGETVSNGSVIFETKSAEQAVVTLKNVIIAYPEVAVDVTMEKQADGSYNFSGEKGMTTAPGTRATATSVIATVKVTGNVTLDGKVQVEATTIVNDPSGWAATYKLGELVLGELDYGASKPRPDVPIASAVYIEWTSTGVPDAAKANTATLNGILGGILLPQVLKSVTLAADGNIRAEYSSDPVTFDMSMIDSLTPESIAELAATKTWQSSPSNLAYWFEKEGKLYLKLNVATIVSQALADKGVTMDLSAIISQVLSGDAASIKELLGGLGINLPVSDKTITMLLDWVKNGVPLNVKSESGHTYIYLDKEVFDLLFTTPEGGKSDFTLLMEMLTPLIPVEYQSTIVFFNRISSLWPITTNFKLGLDLTV